MDIFSSKPMGNLELKVYKKYRNMNTLDHLSTLTKHNKIKDVQGFRSPETIAICVFAVSYLFIRLTESYLIPIIPEWVRSEAHALVRWSPILLPIVFGIIYLKPRKVSPPTLNKLVQDTNDDVLKERMKMWMKIT